MTKPIAQQQRKSLKDHSRFDMISKIRRLSVARRRRSRSVPKQRVTKEPEASGQASGNDIRMQLRRYSTKVRNLTWKHNQRLPGMEQDTEECTSFSDVEEELPQDQSLLHLACMNYPTVDAVEKIVNNAPDLIYQKNSFAQTPLHVASAYGASPRVITYLIELYTDAPNLRDIKGRTPLHLACLCTKLCDAGFSTSSPRDLRKGPLFAVIRTICQASPASVNIEDSQGITPLEYAICSETGPKILRLLQKSSETAWGGGPTDDKDCRRNSFWSMPERHVLHKVPSESYQKYLVEETGKSRTEMNINSKKGRRRFSVPRMMNM